MSKPVAWGISPKNPQQKEALQYLMDPSIDLVILEGIAGSGKTLMALAAGMEQVFEQRMYKEIIFTRSAISLGEDMGFLPGEIGEKMQPWCGALEDNLQLLTDDSLHTQSLIQAKIKTLAMQHMRGRSFNKRYIIIDEVQNITPQQIKTMITRAGEDCKIVVLGDSSQIDNKRLSKENNGLTYLISFIKDVEFIKFIHLPEGERSRLASWAGNML